MYLFGLFINNPYQMSTFGYYFGLRGGVDAQVLVHDAQELVHETLNRAFPDQVPENRHKKSLSVLAYHLRSCGKEPIFYAKIVEIGPIWHKICLEIEIIGRR